MRSRARWAALAAVALAAADGQAGQVPGQPEGWIVRTWRPEDGVPREFVGSMAQDADGFLWLASEVEAARFDGQRFETIDLPPQGADAVPARVIADAGGGPWLAMRGGEAWRWAGDRFERWRRAEGERDQLVAVFPESPGGVLAVSESGRILRGRGGILSTVSPPADSAGPKPRTVRRDADGCIWFVTQSDGVVRYVPAEGRLSPVPVPAGAAPPYDLAVDHAGTPWLATWAGLLRWRNAAFEPVPMPDSAAHPVVRSLLAGPGGMLWAALDGRAWLRTGDGWRGPFVDWEPRIPESMQYVDASGALWLAKGSGGLVRVSAGGEVSETGTNLAAHASAMFGDREGNLWLALYRVGLARVRPARFRSFAISTDGNPNPAWTICEDAEGSIWMNPEFNDPHRWRPTAAGGTGALERVDGLPDWPRVLATDREGGVWADVLATSRLYRFDGRAFVPRMDRPPGAGYALTLRQDRRGDWWLGTPVALYRHHGGRWSDCGAAERGPGAGARVVADDAAGAVWVGTTDAGLARWDGTAFVVLGRVHGLPDERIHALHASADGSLWVGTRRGLARLRGERVEVFTARQGLPDDWIVQLVEDGAGHLWVGTRDGLARIPLRSLEAVAAGSAVRLDAVVFDDEDGLPGRVFQSRSAPDCLRAGDGRLWFLDAHGAVVCDPAAVRLDDVRPRTVLRDIVVDGVSRRAAAAGNPWGDVASPLPDRLELPPGPHVIDLRFTAACLGAGDKVRFEHRLSELASDWTLLGRGQRQVSYHFLPPGRFRFEARACNRDERWSDETAALDIVVRPFFWQTAWFPPVLIAAVVSASAAAVALVLRARHRRRLAQLDRAREREEERARIARDLHDELGGGLTEIGLMSALAAQPSTEGQRPDVDAYLSEIGERAHAMTDALDEIVWAVNPARDTLPSMVRYLRQYAQRFLERTPIRCRLEPVGEVPERPIEADARHQLFLAFKEALTNVVRHSGAAECRIGVVLDGGRLSLSVQDDGRGLSGGLTPEGADGIAGMRQRMERLGGAFRIGPAPGGGGTRVEFELFLPDAGGPKARDHTRV